MQFPLNIAAAVTYAVRTSFTLLCSTVLVCASASGATYTWSGNGGGLLLNLLGNWDSLLPLGSNTTELVFAGTNNIGSAANPLLQNLAHPFVLNRLTFASGVGSVYLAGSDFRFGGTSAAITQNSSSAISITNTIRASSSGVVSVQLAGNGSGIVTMSGAIETGNGSRDYALVKTGSSTFALTGANTYGGGTTIDGGRLIVNNAASLGTGGLRINSGVLQVIATHNSGNAISLGDANSTVDIDAGQTFTTTGFINGAGALNKAGNGTMVISGGTNHTGGTNVAAGELRLGASDQLLDTGSVTVSGGTLNLSGFSDTVGTLTLQSGSITGTGTLTSSSYLLQSGSVSAVLAGTGGMTKSGAGTLTLSGASTYTGGTTINGGTVVVTNAASLGSVTGGLTLNAGTWQIASGFTTTRAVTLGSSASTISVASGQVLNISTTGIVGTGTLNKAGSGTLVLSSGSTYTGGTNVQAGILRLGASHRLHDAGALSVSGGTFDLQTYSETVGAVTLVDGSITGTGTLTSSSGGFSLHNGTVSASLGGIGSVIKTTAGTVTLGRSNSYTGTTSINAGVLSVSANGALGSVGSGTTVASGAALRLNNVSYSAAEPLTINGSGISNGGALVNSGTSMFWGHVTAATHSTINAGGGILTFTGGLTKNGTTLTFTGGGTVNINTIGIGGSSPNSDLVVDGTTVVLNAANTYNGPTTIQNSGTLRLGASNVLPTSPQTALAVNTSSVFDLASRTDSVASLAGDSTGRVRNTTTGTTSTLTVNPASGTSTTFAGLIEGTNGGTRGDMAVIKSGAGTLHLSGANTFSGSTTINGGTLVAAAAAGGALGGTSSITVEAGGRLLLGGDNQLNNSAALFLGGGTIALNGFDEGNAASAGASLLTLTATGSRLDFGTGDTGLISLTGFNPAGFSLLVDNWTGTAETAGSLYTDRLIFDTDQTDNLIYFTFNGYNNGAMQLDLGNGFYEVVPIVPVPEPGTYLAGSIVLFAILFEKWRRRSSIRRARPA